MFKSLIIVATIFSAVFVTAKETPVKRSPTQFNNSEMSLCENLAIQAEQMDPNREPQVFANAALNALKACGKSWKMQESKNFALSAERFCIKTSNSDPVYRGKCFQSALKVFEFSKSRK